MVKVTDERAEFLQHLESIGLIPGAEMDVESASPIDALLHLKIGGNSVTVGSEVCRHVWVEIAD